jgi:hypothetical protein
MDNMASDPQLRFTDILTMASSVASYLGVPDVSAQHVLAGIDILLGRTKMEDLGRVRSPLAPMPPSQYGGAEPAVRELAQRWFERLGNDPEAKLDNVQLAEFGAEVSALRDSAGHA